jgi:flagellar motor switch protein FliN/FliY
MSEEETTAVPPELEDAPSGAVGDIDLDMLMDVPVTMTVEVGRKSLTIKELLSLTPGSVVSFDRSVTEPMDIMINGTLVASHAFPACIPRFDDVPSCGTRSGACCVAEQPVHWRLLTPGNRLVCRRDLAVNWRACVVAPI